MEASSISSSATERRAPAAERERMIAEAAYFIAEHRGFRPGDPVADWLEAETEINRLLEKQSAAAGASAAHDKRAWEETFEAQLRQVEGLLKAFQDKARKGRGRARAEMEGVVSSLSELHAEARSKLTEFRESSGVAWGEVRAGAEKAWNDLRAAADAARSRFVRPSDKEH